MRTWARDGIPTWVHESMVAALILCFVPLITGALWYEWFGVAAVFFSFLHASVADRLSEAERLREQTERLREQEGRFGQYRSSENGVPLYRVHCWKKERQYFLVKEFFWFVYFIALKAWSALVGVGLFLAYRAWRSYYRTSVKPLEGR